MSEDEGQPLDTAALHAQIDLSLSLTFDLVSSWVNVPGQTALTSTHDVEIRKEFESNLHRPPNLGVGAALPAHSAHATTREVARLRGNLLKGSSSSLKRSHNEYLSGGTGLSSSSSNQIASKDDNNTDDEEDSRAGMIRSSSLNEKQVHSRLAIFEGKGGKKTKKKNKPPSDGGRLDVQFAVPLHPTAPLQNASYRTPSNSPSPIRHLKPTSPLSPTIRAFPSEFDPEPEQSPPLSTTNIPLPLSPSHKHKDSVIESSLTSSAIISSTDATETDTDDPRDLGQGSSASSGFIQVQAASSRKRKRRRKNKDKNKNSSADGQQRTDLKEGGAGDG